MFVSRRAFNGWLAGGSLLALPLQRAAAAGEGRVFTPEMFGAKGDGTTNDTLAFQQLAKAVNAAGGGTINFRRTTYLVGAQRHDPASPGGVAFVPFDILQLRKCIKPLVLNGNGARLRCADGLRYGVFDPVSGERHDRPMPNLVRIGQGFPYRYMVSIEGCSGGVSVRNLELDGNAAAAVIGGKWGDTGWQVPATGLALLANPCDEVVQGVHSHHHLLDGMLISGGKFPQPFRRVIERVRCDYNGRQGCSVVSGRGYHFSDCTFAHTGRGPVSSAPGAGVDLEAEAGPIRDLAFLRCRFDDNAGCGMVADSGDSANVTFTGCTFVGTTAWSVWPHKPFFRFYACSFTGALTRCFSGPDAAAATHFNRCTLDDDPGRSSNGKVYARGTIADLSDGTNVRFDACTFTLTHGAVLPWSTRAIYAGCTMRQTAPKASFPRGTYLGTNTITGAVNLSGSKFVGSVTTVNGVRR